MGPFFDFIHDPQSMTVLVHQGQEDLEAGGREGAGSL
jgi:hypothetical protein